MSKLSLITISKIHSIARHPHAIVIGLAFVLLAIGYSLVTPPFEAGDESRHYAVVKYMADTGRLPVQQPGQAQIHWSHEGNQPPLYYALAAGLTFWIETGDWGEVYWYNPHTTIGNPLRPDNKNITIHPPGQAWPWREHVLAVHLIRFLSIAMAAVTVAAGYAIALRLFKGNRWLAAGAMAITAFNPMFIFISASVNNDNAVIMFVTLTLYQLTKPNESIKNPLVYAALLGVLIGLGALSKLYAFGLLPLAGLRLLWLAHAQSTVDKKIQHPHLYPQKSRSLKPHHPSPITRHSSPITRHSSLITRHSSPITRHSSLITHHLSPIFRAALPPLMVFALLFLLVAGWFYLRNAYLYSGDIFALQVMRETAGQRGQAPSLATVRAEFEGFRIAYWALFGGVNILIDDWLYTLLDWLTLIAFLGLLGFIGLLAASHFYPHLKRVRLVSKLDFFLLLGWCVIMIAGVIVWNLTQPAGQGRLLYPAISAISALGMLGLSWWLPATARKAAAGGVALGLFLLAAASPVLYIAPAYAKPPRLSQAELPADIQPVDFTYDGAMRLIGYQRHDDVVKPAQTLSLTLYWQLLEPVDLDYSIFVHLLGRRREVIGQVDSYPGGGAWPTTLLQPGDILAGYYEVPIAAEAELNHAPTRLQIAAGVYDFSEPGRPGRPAVNAAGDPVDPVIGQAKLIPWQWPDPVPSEAPVDFSGKATLLGHQISANQQAVTLYWRADAAFETNYTVFLQAWDTAAGHYVTGFDGPPRQGDYPTTLWAAGEIIVDTHPLELSQLGPGRYHLLAGLYDPLTGERLPAFDAGGPLPDYAVNLGQIHVESPQKDINR